MSKLVLFCLVFWVGSVFASVPVNVHSHKVHIEGVLPSPYETFSLNIELNVETDDVEKFELFRGSELIKIPSEIISELKNVELWSLDVTHEMHRFDENRPAFSEYGDKGDWLHISFAIGDMYRAEKEFDGIGYFKWGYDSVTITIVKDKTVTLKLNLLDEIGGNWSKKTW